MLHRTQTIFPTLQLKLPPHRKQVLQQPIANPVGLTGQPPSLVPMPPPQQLRRVGYGMGELGQARLLLEGKQKAEGRAEPIPSRTNSQDSSLTLYYQHRIQPVKLQKTAI
jgi:hypothetical protein